MQVSMQLFREAGCFAAEGHRSMHGSRPGTALHGARLRTSLRAYNFKAAVRLAFKKRVREIIEQDRELLERLAK